MPDQLHIQVHAFLCVSCRRANNYLTAVEIEFLATKLD